MIKQLRKRHWQIWIAWAILIPLGIITAWIAIPGQQANDVLQPAKSAALPVLVKSVQKENYTANIRCSQNDSVCQLEYINKLPLTVPSALMYRINKAAKNIDENHLLGRIESKGTYYFPLRADHKNDEFILYDFIHQKVIDTLKF